MAKTLAPMDPKMVVNYEKLKGVSCIVLCEPGEEPIFKWFINLICVNLGNCLLHSWPLLELYFEQSKYYY